MISFEEIKDYLPKYLTPESEKTLFEEVKRFPENIDSRLYTNYLKDENIIFQGDGIEGLLFVNFPDQRIGKVPAIILSNTCDIYPENVRLFRPNIIYSPIINLEKYKDNLLQKRLVDAAALSDHITTVRKQLFTSIFYLPKGGSLAAESMVFLDKINCCDSAYLTKHDLKKLRIFTLSNYGLYLFVLKLSIHFTRITESVDRRVDLEDLGDHTSEKSRLT